MSDHRPLELEDGDRRSSSSSSPPLERRRTSSRDGEEEDEQKVKCVVIGDKDVGKTALIWSYLSNSVVNPDDHERGSEKKELDITTGKLKIGDDEVTFDIIDLAGSGAQHLRDLYYGKTNVFLVCFAMNNPASFENAISLWFKEIQSVVDENAVPTILVATKQDCAFDPKVGCMVGVCSLSL